MLFDFNETKDDKELVVRMYLDVSRREKFTAVGISEKAPEWFLKLSALNMRKIKKAKPHYDGYRSGSWCEAGCSPDIERSKR